MPSAEKAGPGVWLILMPKAYRGLMPDPYNPEFAVPVVRLIPNVFEGTPLIQTCVVQLTNTGFTQAGFFSDFVVPVGNYYELFSLATRTDTLLEMRLPIAAVPQTASSTSFSFYLEAGVGCTMTVQLETSQDLSTWQTVKTFTQAGNTNAVYNESFQGMTYRSVRFRISCTSGGNTARFRIFSATITA